MSVERSRDMHLLRSQEAAMRDRRRFQVDVGMQDNLSNFKSGNGEITGISLTQVIRKLCYKTGWGTRLIMGLGAGSLRPLDSGLREEVLPAWLNEIAVSKAKAQANRQWYDMTVIGNCQPYDRSWSSVGEWATFHWQGYVQTADGVLVPHTYENAELPVVDSGAVLRILQYAQIYPIAQLMFTTSERTEERDERFYVGKVDKRMTVADVCKAVTESMEPGKVMLLLAGNLSEVVVRPLRPEGPSGPFNPDKNDPQNAHVVWLPPRNFTGYTVISYDTGSHTSVYAHTILPFFTRCDGGHIEPTAVVEPGTEVLAMKAHQFLSVDK